MALWETRHERNPHLCECGYDITNLHIPAERNAHFARHHVYRRGVRLGKSFPFDRDIALGEDVEMALDQLSAARKKATGPRKRCGKKQNARPPRSAPKRTVRVRRKARRSATPSTRRGAGGAAPTAAPRS
jgi:hypothetical protein